MNKLNQLNQLNLFFNDVKYIFKEKKQNDQRTNVIYLNTDCNLRCRYCYEKDSKDGLVDQVNCTTQMIDEFIDEIVRREKNIVSTIVIMGGEPFLKFDLIEYTIKKCFETQHEFGISIITNGTLFTDLRFKEIKYLIEACKKVKVSLEISYDGSGQFRRMFGNGYSSRKKVESTFQELEKREIPYRISYTAHAGNYKNIFNDCYNILKKKNKMLKRITVGYAFQDIDDIGQDAKLIKKEFIREAIILFKQYGIPICGHTCGICKQCNKSNFVGNSYLSPVSGISYDEKKTEHLFKQFKE